MKLDECRATQPTRDAGAAIATIHHGHGLDSRLDGFRARTIHLPAGPQCVWCEANPDEIKNIIVGYPR